MTQPPRQFQKFFSRSLPISTMEYWFQGEYIELPKIIDKATHFNPLFISEAGLTDVYYDINNPNTAVQPLFDYIRKSPATIDTWAQEFISLEETLKTLLNNPKEDDITEIFTTVSRAWGYLPLWIQYGETDESVLPKHTIEIAHTLRDTFQYVEYRAGEVLLELIRASCNAQHKPYAEVIMYSEYISHTIPASEILQDRKEHGFMYFEDRVYLQSDIETVEHDNNIVRISDLAIIGDMNSLGEHSVIENVEELIIMGRPAHPGKVIGSVVCVLGIQDLARINSDSVLVTTMTHPDFIHEMKRAIAFVTDEGGITCHAAIVAREMKKPCIVGTKIATHVLKDGDIVEVDANSGIVRILVT